MSLLALPNELLENVGKFLWRLPEGKSVNMSQPDLNSLSKTCRHLYNVINRALYRRNALHAEYTAMYWAAQIGNEDTIRRALTLGIDMGEACRKHGMLCIATFSQQLRVLRFLLELDIADPNDGTPLDWTALHAAAYKDCVEAVNLLLEHGASVCMETAEGVQPLYVAARWNALQVAKVLLKNGADPNASTKNGETPLMVAALKAGAEMIHILVAAGARFDDMTRHGMSAMDLAMSSGNTETTRALLQHGVNVDPTAPSTVIRLGLAAINGDTELVRILLDAGANLHTTRALESMALKLAVFFDQVDMLELFLQHGADIEAALPGGSTYLIIAASGNSLQMVRMLLRNGANVDATDVDGRTATIAAACNRDGEVLKLLLASHPNVDHFAVGVGTALLVAVLNKDFNASKRLLEYGCNVHPAIRGFTALHIAIICGHVNLVRVLLYFGASPMATVDSGHNALELAVLVKKEMVVSVIRKHIEAQERNDGQGMDADDSTDSMDSYLEDIRFLWPDT